MMRLKLLYEKWKKEFQNNKNMNDNIIYTIVKLQALVNLGVINADDAWSTFRGASEKKIDYDLQLSLLEIMDNSRNANLFFNLKDLADLNIDNLNINNNDTESLKKLFRENGILTDYLKKKAHHRCNYCKRRISSGYNFGYQIDHVFSKAKNPGLTFNIDNLCLACIECNKTKNCTIDNKKDRPYIINPNYDNYSDHINFTSLATESFYYLKYNGIDAKGKTTIECLNFKYIENEELSLNFKNSRINDLCSTIESVYQIYVNNESDDSNHIIEFMLKMKREIFDKKFPQP